MNIIKAFAVVKAKALALSLLLLISGMADSACLAQTTSKPEVAGALVNDPIREAEFMDWGLGMFVHWSLSVSIRGMTSARTSNRIATGWRFPSSVLSDSTTTADGPMRSSCVLRT